MNVIIEGKEYLPLAVAANQLATTELRILMLVKRRALEVEMVEGEWYVSTASLAGYDPAEGPKETPPSCKTSCTSSTCGYH